MKNIFIVFFLLLTVQAALNAEFIKDGNIVKDTSHNLEWQDNVVSSPMKWHDAIQKCELLKLSAHSTINEDWRLPNINELKLIMDDTKTKPVYISAFTKLPSSLEKNYWSSTTSAGQGNQNLAWYIDFYDSQIRNDGNKATMTYYLICVRDSI